MNQEKETEARDTINNKHALHAAVLKNDFDEASLLLKNGADPNAVDKLGRTPLHCAAIISSTQLLQLLIQNGASSNFKIQKIHNIQTVGHDNGTQMGHETGRTALHFAAAQLDYDCVEALLKQETNVNCVDDKGLTPLMVTGESLRKSQEKSNYERKYEKIISILLERNANINIYPSEGGESPLQNALEFGSLSAFRELLKKGADTSKTDSNGDTILHVTCKKGEEHFANEILAKEPSMVNIKNRNGDTPLHCAALFGSRPCLTLLINNGGDLSQTNASNLTVCDLIFSNVARPLNFLVETLDSKLIPNECSINDKNFTVTLDFEVLTPNDGQQSSVLISLINSLPHEQKPKIVLHPLIVTFIKLKWARLKILFFLLVMIHFMFVMSLSVHLCLLIKGQTMFAYNWSRFVLLFTSIIIFIHVITEICLSYKYFLKEFETWLTLTCVSLSLIIGFWETFFMQTPLPPLWIRHLAAYDVLLSWILLMFILGRFPLMGYVALMFYTVLKNLLKVLLFFTCLVIGFSLSFCIQFNDMQFDDPWKAFVRTTIMLMGEYEYGELFGDKIIQRFKESEGNLFVTSRIIFLLFVLLGSIVLVNLLTGLAVSDIQGLRADGCLQHLIKQVEFVSHVEKIMRKNLNRKLIPPQLIRILNRKQILPRMITIKPNLNEKICEINHKKKLEGLSTKLIESIMLRSIKNQKKNLKSLSGNIILKDGFDIFKDNRNQWIDTHINDALNDIKHDLHILLSYLLNPKNKDKFFKKTL